MITQEQFASLFSDEITKKQYDAIIRQIDTRFAEICEKFLVKRRDSWYDYDTVSYDDDNSRGVFDPDLYAEEIGIAGEWIDPPPGYDLCFPTRWLWQDFEDELKENIEAFKSQQASKKEKEKRQRENRKNRLSELQASIKAKLTPEELKAVRFIK